MHIGATLHPNAYHPDRHRGKVLDVPVWYSGYGNTFLYQGFSFLLPVPRYPTGFTVLLAGGMILAVITRTRRRFTIRCSTHWLLLWIGFLHRPAMKSRPSSKDCVIITVSTAPSVLNRQCIVSMSPVHLTFWCSVRINGAITNTTYFICWHITLQMNVH